MQPYSICKSMAFYYFHEKNGTAQGLIQKGGERT